MIFQKSKIPKHRQRLFYNNYRFKNKDDEKNMDEFDISTTKFLIDIIFNVSLDSKTAFILRETVNADHFGFIKVFFFF